MRLRSMRISTRNWRCGELVLLVHLLEAVFDGIGRTGDHDAQRRVAGAAATWRNLPSDARRVLS